MHEHDRQGTGHPQQLLQRHAAGGQDGVRSKAHQFSRHITDTVFISCAPANVDPYVSIVGPTQLLQALLECCEAWLGLGIVRIDRHEHTDALHPLGLLRAPCWRPDRRRAENCDEFPPPHSTPHMHNAEIRVSDHLVWGAAICCAATSGIVEVSSGSIAGAEGSVRSRLKYLRKQTKLLRRPSLRGHCRRAVVSKSASSRYRVAIHSMISSARATSAGGRSRPMARAVFMLMMN